MKLQENRANTANINETVADIIVAEMRARFRKTGARVNSYDEFIIEDIAEEVGGRKACFDVSTWVSPKRLIPSKESTPATITPHSKSALANI